VPDTPFTALLVRFAAELRTAGLAVGSGDVLVYCSALARLDPSDLVDLYWAGRSTLVSRRDDIARYDEVFRRFFLGTEVPDEELSLMLRASAQAQGALAIPAVEPGDSGEQDEAVLGWMASDVEALKHKSFAACTPEELAALRRIMARIRLTPPRRRTRRTAPARVPTPAGPCGSPCACRANPPGCTGGGGRSGCDRWYSSWTSPDRWPTTRAACCSSRTRPCDQRGDRRGRPPGASRSSASAPG
jgi:hypothetical protein